MNNILSQAPEQLSPTWSSWSDMVKDIALAAIEAETIPEALRKTLDLVCVHTGWPLGHVYYRSSSSKTGLLSTSIWSADESERWECFKRATETSEPSIEEGLPGAVFAAQKPVYYNDLPHTDFVQIESAQECGIQAAVAFPVIAGDEIVAILEFLSEKPINEDGTLNAALSKIGANLGRVVARQRAEAEIRASHQQLATAQRIAQMGSWEWDIRSDAVLWSDELFRIYGLDPQILSVTYEAYQERIHPDDREKVERVIQEALQTRNEFELEHRILRPDHEIRIVRGHGRVILDPSGKPVRMIGVSQDITEQKRMEERLLASYELIRKTVMAAPFILWAIDRDGLVILLEGRGLSTFGVQPHDIVGKSIYKLIGTRPEILAQIQRAQAGEDVVADINSENELFESRYSPIRDDAGEVIGVIGLLIDIKDRTRIEAALRASEARFRAIFEGSAVGIAMVDLDRRFLTTNPAFQNMLGYSAVALWGKNLSEVIHPVDDSRNSTPIQSVLQGEKDLSQVKMRFLRNDGNVIWVNTTLSLTRKDDGSPWFAILMVEDISLRVQMEAELVEVQRRLVVGREHERLYLAQELHDDPLQELYGLMYRLDEFKVYLEDDQSLAELQEAQITVNRIINTLRGISRELRPPTLAPFGLEGAIRELCDRIQEDHPEIKLHLDLMRDGQRLSEEVRLTLYRILQQALTNVIRHSKANNVYVRFKFDQGSDILEIEDDGIGFEVPPRWVPFVREGHLGLAGSEERAETINGYFSVISSPGKGAMVRVSVPFEKP
jgi:PAS domain S-box-containing protein